MTADEIFLIEQRMPAKSVYDPLDDLLAAAPAKMRDCFDQLAKGADGGRAAAAVLGPELVCLVLEEHESRLGELRVQLLERRHSAWPLLKAGMLREFCAMEFRQIAQNSSCSTATANRRYHAHCRARARVSAYAETFEAIARRCIAETVELDDKKVSS